MDIFEFCDKVEREVERHYGKQDGGDLCHSLVEQGQIDMSRGVAEAARLVAQLMEQA